MRFDDKQQFEGTRAENTDEPEVPGKSAEVRTGRGSAGLVRGGDERVGRTRPAGKAKERVSMKAKEEDLAAKENSKRRERKRRRNVRNNAKKKRERPEG